MALTTYTSTNNHGDPISQTVIDSGTFSAPTVRASVFTPVAGYVAPTTATDYSVGSTPTVRSQVFEPPSFSATLDPGMIVNG